jgi:hypothetical protein
VTCGVPGSFKVIEPNAPICKIQLLKEALDSENRRLSSETKRIVTRVYNKLRLKKESEVEMAEVR